MNDPVGLIGVAFLWSGMVPVLLGSYLRRRGWITLAAFCEGVAIGLTISALTLMLFVLLKETGR